MWCIFRLMNWSCWNKEKKNFKVRENKKPTGHLQSNWPARERLPTQGLGIEYGRPRTGSDRTPIKPGKILVCLDPSQTLNKAIRRPKYIIPTLEENPHKLHGMRYRLSLTSRKPSRTHAPKQWKGRPYWCIRPILWKLNPFLKQPLSLCSDTYLHSCWSRKWKRSTITCN